MKNHYKTLGLEEGASQEAIQAAYDHLYDTLDPAKNDNLDFFIEEHALVIEAYNTLKKNFTLPPKVTKAKKSDSIEIIFEDYKTSTDAQKIDLLKKINQHINKGELTYKIVLNIICKFEKCETYDVLLSQLKAKILGIENSKESKTEELPDTKNNDSAVVAVNDADTPNTLVEKYTNAPENSKKGVLALYKGLCVMGNSKCALALHEILGEELPHEDSIIAMFVAGIVSNSQACSEAIIPQGKGEFGLSKTNPVPVYGIPSNEIYLRRLQTSSGEKITWKRKGSFTISNIENEIDEYIIFNANNTQIATIFISPYHWKTSTKFPKGFIDINATPQNISEEINKKEGRNSNSTDLFDDKDTLVSIIKKFRGSENAEKLEIIKSLEAFKGSNETYQQALAMIYKNEGVDSSENFEEKSPTGAESDKQTSKDNSITAPPKTPIAPIQNKKKGFQKTVLIVLAVLSLLFGLPYGLFLNKVSQLQNNITSITEQSQTKQLKSKNLWQTKFYAEHPEIVARHETDNTNKGFQYEETDRKEIKDSLVSFFIYKKTIPIDIYKPFFFKCVYRNSVNSYNYWNHYIVGNDDKNQTNKIESPYLIMRQYLLEKHGVTNQEFDDLLAMVGDLKVFHIEKPSTLDIECKECVKNYRTNYVTNQIAINEFYEFTKQYLGDQQRILNSNNEVIHNYNIKYNELTSGMSSSLLDKLKTKIDEKPMLTSKTVTESYLGTSNGLGVISYSLQKNEFDLMPLKGYVNEIYAAYYSENSLYTGATPYSYCYGKNPYCYPPNGYEECSFIDIKASSSSDVVVIIKKNSSVYAHAYIKAGGYYKFKLGNGNFQAFFYYGKGWNPKKYIKTSYCGKILGGFVSNESLDKSDVLNLYNSSMTYTLYTVENGNFKPAPSNKNEAF